MGWIVATFAQYEATLILCSLLKRYALQFVPGQTAEEVHAISVQPKDEIHLTATQRSCD